MLAHFNINLIKFISLWNFRTKLAALHFNENAQREQAKTAKGEKRYSVLYPKFKKGGHVVKAIKESPTYSKPKIPIKPKEYITQNAIWFTHLLN